MSARNDLGNGDWVVNKAMNEKVTVTVEPQRTMSGGMYVHDDHIKNTYEILVAAFSGYNFSIVRDNNRSVFCEMVAIEDIFGCFGVTENQGREMDRADK